MPEERSPPQPPVPADGPCGARPAAGEPPPSLPEEVLGQARDLLAAHHVLTLASRDALGSWAAPVFFASDGLDLFFMSSPNARHVRSLAFDPHLAGAIHGPAHDWRSIVGLQISGPTQQLQGAEAAAALAIYARRFPFVADGTDGALAKAIEKAAWYRLRITEAVIVDNRRGLGRHLRWSCRTAAAAP